jgi:hypothetical protein
MRAIVSPATSGGGAPTIISKKTIKTAAATDIHAPASVASVKSLHDDCNPEVSTGLIISLPAAHQPGNLFVEVDRLQLLQQARHELDCLQVVTRWVWRFPQQGTSLVK